MADPNNVVTDEDTSLEIILAGTDIDGHPLSYHLGSNPNHGALSGTAPNLTYIPNPNYNGLDAFTFTVERDY